MIPKAKQQLLDQYGDIAAKLTPDVVDTKRQTFLAKYPSDVLPTLAGDALMRAVHGDAPKTGLFYDLEFADEFTVFGSIGGGSSLKFKVYRAADGSGYKKKGPGNAPIPCPDDEAERMTREMIQGLHRALNAVDTLNLSGGDPVLWHDFDKQTATETYPSFSQLGHDTAVTHLAWGHKYLAICRPDLFSFHHQPRNLSTHLVRLGEVPHADGGRYLLDWQWRFLRQNDADLRDLHPVVLMKAIYAAFNPQTAYWRIGTDEQGVDRWPAMGDGGFASIGWAFLGDLRDELSGLEGTAAHERLKALLSTQDWAKATSPQQIGKWASQIHQFYARMRPGDRIMAMKGHQLLGVGEITGVYDYYPNDIQPHHREVTWHGITPEQWSDAPGFRTTIYEFSDRPADAVRVEKALLTTDPLPVIAPPNKDLTIFIPDDDGVASVTPLIDPVPLKTSEQRIKDILERKGQVILYGPPGTGKTYNARQTARELVARERCGGRDWAMLNETQRQTVDEAISFVTFHPAYAYEDFIEGYRPLVSTTGSGPAFELRDGLFIEVCERARKEPDRHFLLLIDEINRGNVAAVLGELITLLEADKRDSIAAILPLSRRAFLVPKNLWIIGTMNTADRSISLLDAALRRRFGFVELLPEPERVAVTVNGLSLSALLKEINARIRKHVTRNARELQVGHAYLMRGGQALQTPEDLLAAFRDDILPLLAEYCFENYATLARIVGDEIIDVKEQTPSPTFCADPAKLHKALMRLVSADPARDSELGDSEDNDTGAAPESDDDMSEDADLNVGNDSSDASAL